MSFEEWMFSYPNHKYTEATVQRYTRALKKAEDWLGIKLPRQVMDVDSVEVFNDIEKQIKKAHNYEELNRAHGHGDLSAALSNYRKYLEDFESSARRVHTEKTVKEIVDSIDKYIAIEGFKYDGNLIENFYLCLKSKPFVILAGTSGTGKTRLVKLFAEAIGAEYKMVPVRPDWSDSSDLFGHVDLNGKFVPGVILEYIRQAADDPDRPYFLCLDEMNLARVEYYLSDFLSVIETRDFDGDRIVSDALVPDTLYGQDTEARNKYGELRFPENLYVVGTVNMDETTFPFSKKVLDRANTIEFDHVDLRPVWTEAAEAEAITVGNDFLRTQYLFLGKCTGEQELIGKWCARLVDINGILAEANAHVGYRIRDEICFYLLNNKNAGDLLKEEEAFDLEILQKILPRIQGSTSAIRAMISRLFREICMNDHSDKKIWDAEQMKKALDGGKKPVYPESAAKLIAMMTRYEEEGFTSYWL